MIILSVDLGLVRTGLAICDKYELMAHPLVMIKESNFEKICGKIIDKIKDTNAQLVVIGFPINMDGSKGESAQRSVRLKDALTLRLNNIDVILWDERKTTTMATTYLNVTNVRGRKRKNIIDMVSATIMLEEYIRYRRTYSNL